MHSPVGECPLGGWGRSRPIDILAVSDTLNLNDLPFSQYLIDDTVVANADAIGVFRASQLLGAVRARLFGKLLDSRDNPSDFLLWELA